MKKMYQIGGVRIGTVNFTWPFAVLHTTKEKLIIKTFFEKVVFLKLDVKEIKEYMIAPFIGEGIQIIHSNPQYPAFIVFWYWKPKKLIQKIKGIGFIS